MTDNLTQILAAKLMETKPFDWWGLVGSLIPVLLFVGIVIGPDLMGWIRKLRNKSVIRKWEKTTGRRLMVLAHSFSPSFFNLVPSFISVDDSIAVLRAIRNTPAQQPIDLILHTPGGMVLAAEQIVSALQHHQGGYHVYVPYLAMSGGTLLALGAEKIHMAQDAVLGPLDPQLSTGLLDSFPAVSILKAVAENSPNREDKTLIMADVARKACQQMGVSVRRIIGDRLPCQDKESLADILTKGEYTHDYGINYQRACDLHLWVDTVMPKEIFTIAERFPITTSLKYQKNKKSNTDIQVQL